MARYPVAIEELIQALTILPGVGRKTAEHYTFFLVKQSPETVARLIKQLQAVRQSIRLCERCFNYAIAPLCVICADPQRDQQTICVVAEGTIILTLEQTGQFQGVYHVLGGYIDHAAGIGPTELHVPALVERIKRDQIEEVIFGTNPDLAGDATVLYVTEALKDLPVRITKLARGLAAGSDIEFADDLTLTSALRDRKPVSAE